MTLSPSVLVWVLWGVLLVGGLALLCRVASRLPGWMSFVLVAIAVVGMWFLVGRQFGTHVLFRLG